MLNLHVRREPGRDGKIPSDHRQDGNDEARRLKVTKKRKKEKKKCPSRPVCEGEDGSTGVASATTTFIAYYLIPW